MITITNKLLNKETQEREKNGPSCPNDFHLKYCIFEGNLKMKTSLSNIASSTPCLPKD